MLEIAPVAWDAPSSGSITIRPLTISKGGLSMILKDAGRPSC